MTRLVQHSNKTSALLLAAPLRLLPSPSLLPPFPAFSALPLPLSSKNGFPFLRLTVPSDEPPIWTLELAVSFGPSIPRGHSPPHLFQAHLRLSRNPLYSRPIRSGRLLCINLHIQPVAALGASIDTVPSAAFASAQAFQDGLDLFRRRTLQAPSHSFLTHFHVANRRLRPTRSRPRNPPFHHSNLTLRSQGRAVPLLTLPKLSSNITTISCTSSIPILAFASFPVAFLDLLAISQSWKWSSSLAKQVSLDHHVLDAHAVSDAESRTCVILRGLAFWWLTYPHHLYGRNLTFSPASSHSSCDGIGKARLLPSNTTLTLKTGVSRSSTQPQSACDRSPTSGLAL